MALALDVRAIVDALFLLIITSGEASYLAQKFNNQQLGRFFQGILILAIGFLFAGFGINSVFDVLPLGAIVTLIGVADYLATKFPNLAPFLDPTQA